MLYSIGIAQSNFIFRTRFGPIKKLGFSSTVWLVVILRLFYKVIKVLLKNWIQKWADYYYFFHIYLTQISLFDTFGVHRVECFPLARRTFVENRTCRFSLFLHSSSVLLNSCNYNVVRILYYNVCGLFWVDSCAVIYVANLHKSFVM